MPSNTRRMSAALSTFLDRDAGVERDASGNVVAFRLFRAGVSRTDHGETVFDDEAARAVMAERAKRGNRFALDYDHASLSPTATPEQRRAAGSFDIELRSGELWAVDLRLTEEARCFLREGSYLSVSPAWDQDSKTGRVVSLCNCALTSNPATHGAVRLAASRMATVSRADSIPSDILRMTARSCPDARLASKAVAELARRGETVSDDPALERMRVAAGRGSRPLVRNEGCAQVFPVMTAAEARAMKGKHS